MSVKKSTDILQKLRGLMQSLSDPLAAYIIPSTDAHMSEYIAPCDKRREFLTGFTGSAGTAVVTDTQAALWTDGRYHLQAEQQLDSNWTLMKDGLAETPTQGQWLCNELEQGSKVGIDPSLVDNGSWQRLSKELNSYGIYLQPVKRNLVDMVWSSRPHSPCNPTMVQSMEYAGLTWAEKVATIHKHMQSRQVEVLVLTALDEIAWVLNLRGNDIEYNPVFFAFLILTFDTIFFYINEEKLGPNCRVHLGFEAGGTGSIGGNSGIRIQLRPYDEILNDLAAQVDLHSEGKVWISDKVNYAVYNVIPEERCLVAPSVVAELKCIKNQAEIAGMQSAHLKDAMALCEFFAWLETQVGKRPLSELDCSQKVLEFRQIHPGFVSNSFETISASGPNAAIIHYRPMPDSNHSVSQELLYLIDSGAQYIDGTTDVTRTVHMGKPSRYQQECFTRVMKGHINLMKAVFPNGVKGHRLDAIARLPLWEKGFDYLHGTGHGVGSFLNVHEGPCSISYRVRADEMDLKEGMVLSNEPGYYEDKAFGIRIESLMLVVKAQTLYNFKDKGFLTFEPLTLVPIQTKMIIPELLTQAEMNWINAYHDKCRAVVGPELLKHNMKDAYYWLLRETQHVMLPEKDPPPAKDMFRPPHPNFRHPDPMTFKFPK